jgi:uncharacterized protein Veg
MVYDSQREMETHTVEIVEINVQGRRRREVLQDGRAQKIRIETIKSIFVVLGAFAKL